MDSNSLFAVNFEELNNCISRLDNIVKEGGSHSNIEKIINNIKNDFPEDSKGGYTYSSFRERNEQLEDIANKLKILIVATHSFSKEICSEWAELESTMDDLDDGSDINDIV